LSCRVCKDPRAPEILQRVYNEDLTIADAARMLGVSYQLLWRHMRYHEVSDKKAVELDIDALQLLKEITFILKDRLDEVKNLPTGLLINERMVTMLTRDLRETIMDLERLTGRLRTAPLIQLQQIHIHYEKLLAFITRSLCSSCRKKVAKWLEHER